MADGTAIEWAETTWNPVTGCDRISDGCDNCYALTLARRLKAMGSPHYQTDGNPKTSGPGFGLAMHGDALTIPQQWRKPRLVFVNSMSDLFHSGVTTEFIANVFAVMASTPRHTYQILSKRHGRMRSLLNSREFVDLVRSRYCGGFRWPLPNVWMGVSVESQRWADIRIRALAQTPAAVRFLSCEPLLSPITLTRHHAHCPTHDFPGGFCTGGCPDMIVPDWAIIGGESGPGARPMDLDWARSIVGQCRESGVPVFVKQLGSVWAKWAGAKHHKGGDPVEWPEDLRVREMPRRREAAKAGA